MNRNLVTAFGAIVSSRLVIVVVSTVFAPLLVRLLGFGTYGAYAAVIALFDLLMIPVSSGVNSGVRRYIAEDRDRKGWQSYVFVYFFRVAVMFALIAAFALVVAAQVGLVAWLYGPSYTPYFFLLAVLVITAQLREYTRRTLMGLQLEHLGEPLNVLFRVTFALIALLLAARGFGVVGVLVGQIVASLLGFCLAIGLVSRRLDLGKLVERIPDSYPKTKFFAFNYNTVFYIFLLTSLYKIDQILLGVLSPSARVGYYRAALVLVQFLWIMPRSFQSLMMQSVSDHWNKGRTDVIEGLATRVTRYVLLLTLLLGIGLGALAPVVVPLYYGPNAVPAIQPLLILLPGTICVAVARPLLTITHAKGDMRVVIAAAGAAACTNLVGNVLLIPLFGLRGAAVATTVGYGTLALSQVWAARTAGYHPFADARLPQIGATALLSGIAIWGLATGLGPTPLAALGVPSVWSLHRIPIALVIVPPVGFFLYGGLALVTGAVTLTEVDEILSHVPDPIGSTVRSFID